MRKEKQIFIGSSEYYVRRTKKGQVNKRTYKNCKLKRIFEAIDNIGFQSIPWWSVSNFNVGLTKLENLITVSKKYYGGIFILNRDFFDPKTTERGYSNLNVLLEAGMFYSSRGMRRTMLLTDGNYEDLKYLKDIEGYITADLNDVNIKNIIKDFFTLTEDVDETKFDKIRYFISNYISEQIEERNYLGWETKGLYIGNKSARIWNNIENSKSYKVNIIVLRKFLDETINNNLIDFKLLDNVVSFGCGNGKTDNLLLQKIAETNNFICYIPIDINPLLIYYASKNIDKTIRLPFSIVDDFEIEVKHIQKIIDGKKSEIGDKNLFIMLGVTFSNLEGKESTIFNMIKKWMSNGDYFLIDVSINNKRDLENLTQALGDAKYSKLFYNSLLKKEIIKGIPPEDITYTINLVENPEKNRYTEISSTQVYSYQYNGRNVMISKRYDYKDIKQKIETNFTLINSKQVKSQSNRDKAFFLFKNR